MIREYYQNGKLKIKAYIETKYDTLPSRKEISPFISKEEYDSLKTLRLKTPLDSIQKNWIFTYITSLSGKYLSFHENGKRMIEGNYSFEQLEKMSQEEFSEKAQNFHYKSYKNGYMFDAKNGKWNFWDKEGKLVKTETYKKDSLLKTEIFVNESSFAEKKLHRGDLLFLNRPGVVGN